MGKTNKAKTADMDDFSPNILKDAKLLINR